MIKKNSIIQILSYLFSFFWVRVKKSEKNVPFQTEKSIFSNEGSYFNWVL